MIFKAQRLTNVAIRAFNRFGNVRTSCSNQLSFWQKRCSKGTRSEDMSKTEFSSIQPPNVIDAGLGKILSALLGTRQFVEKIACNRVPFNK